MKYHNKNNINIIATSRGDNKDDSSKSKSPKKKKKIKFDFKKKKENTINSLYQVEHFLSDFKQFSKYAKLYFLLK